MKVIGQGDIKITRTVCSICPIACGILAHVKDGVLTKVEPADFPEPKYRHICAKGLCTPKMVNHPDRLKYPMKRIGERDEGKWQRITWEEALDTIAGKLKVIREKYGAQTLAFINGGMAIPNGGHFLGMRFANTIEATWVKLPGSGSAGQGCANNISYGTSGLEGYLVDQDNPRLCVYWGANTLETGKWKYHRFRDAREKGARIVVISPIFNPTVAKADEWIPVRPGTDAALALGMVNLIIKEGLYDEPFLISRTVGPFLVRSDNGLFLREGQSSSVDSSGKYMVWDTKTGKPQPYDMPGIAPALRGSYTSNGIECKPAFQLLAEQTEKYSLQKVSEITEVAPEAIKRLARDYATLKPVASDKGYGLSRNFRGDLAHRAIITLAAVTGNIRLRDTELNSFPILNWRHFMAPAGKIAKQVNLLPFYDMALTDKPYSVRALWVTSHNPANSHGNRNKFLEIMSRMELVVVVELFMSATAEHADIVLPGCTPFESTNFAPSYQHYYGGHAYLQLQPKVIDPYYECKTDMEIFTELAKRMGLGQFFDKTAEEYINLLLSGHPSLEGINVEKLREGPVKPKPYNIPLLSTPSGRIEFYVEKMKKFGEELPVYVEPPSSVRQPLDQRYPLCLFSTHGKYREHSILVNVGWMRELEPEPVLNMNAMDAQKRGIQDGDMTIAFNDRGRVKVKAIINEAVRPGAVNISEGWWPRDFVEGSHQELTDSVTSPAQEASYESMAQMQGIPIEVRKA